MAPAPFTPAVLVAGMLDMSRLDTRAVPTTNYKDVDHQWLIEPFLIDHPDPPVIKCEAHLPLSTRPNRRHAASTYLAHRGYCCRARDTTNPQIFMSRTPHASSDGSPSRCDDSRAVISAQARAHGPQGEGQRRREVGPQLEADVERVLGKQAKLQAARRAMLDGPPPRRQNRPRRPKEEGSAERGAEGQLPRAPRGTVECGWCGSTVPIPWRGRIPTASGA